jgi:preprotein translocase subunit SecD
VQSSLQELIALYDPGASAPAAADTLAADSAAVAVADTSLDLSTLTAENEQIANPLLRVLNPIQVGPTGFGTIAERDTAAFNELMRSPEAREILPPDVELMFKRVRGAEDQLIVLAVRDEVELTGDVVTDAAVDFDPSTNAPMVSMEMNGEGARTWSRITGANVGEQVAIVMDGFVYSDPVIRGRISGGRTSIEGLDSRAEASDIVTILKSGSLPAPVDIIEERTVGPSLGAASIRAGFTSLLVGLSLVALFMIFYYRGAGAIADIALLLNIIFVLGILGAFQATLTLPGVAGIVLTIGMAVDANVLIFDRVREEVGYGRTLRGAIDAGYEKAFSSILDANVTTFFTGLILYSFGVGPIKGFAVTLMAGIIASLFSALVITRIAFDYLVTERRQTVSLG